MPIFFLLSGFCLTLAYGQKKYAGFTVCCGFCESVHGCACKPCKNIKNFENHEEIFNARAFYKGRAARIVPVYYVCNLIALPLIYLGRVTRGRYNPILSPSHRVVEQQLLIPGFLPEFLETSGDQENLRFLEKVATTGNLSQDFWVKVR